MAASMAPVPEADRRITHQRSGEIFQALPYLRQGFEELRLAMVSTGSRAPGGLRGDRGRPGGK